MIKKHHHIILSCLQNTFLSNENKISKIKQKAISKVVQVFKKSKSLNNLFIINLSKIPALRD